MRDFTLTYVVSSESSENLCLARQAAAELAHPDRLHTHVGQAKDRVLVEHHRLGDYFSSVRISDRDSTSFWLAFVPRHNVGRYWKDLVVELLSSIRNRGVSVRSEKK